MRSISLPFTGLGLALMTWAGALQPATAQTNLQLVWLTNTMGHVSNTVWRYNTNGVDLGTTWRATNYVETGWGTGIGVFAVEDLAAVVPMINTRLQLTAPGSSTQVITYYFRTTFNFPFSVSPASNTIVLLSSNILDDGCVFYINGTEAGRIRITANPVLYSSLADQGTEGVFELLALDTSALRQGTNVLAVEVHQTSTTSSDVVFGMALFATVTPAAGYTRVTITNQPKSVVCPLGSTATFSVGASGTDPRYQWRTNNVAIPGATNASFTTPTMSTANQAAWNGARFSVTITNLISSTNSTNATLWVVPDTFGPKMILALATNIIFTNATTQLVSNYGRVLVTFDEQIQEAAGTFAAATNLTNYALSVLNRTNIVGLTRARWGGLQVELTTTTNEYLGTPIFVFTNTYVLRVNNLRDPRTNYIAPNAQIPLSYITSTNLIDFEFHPWRSVGPAYMLDTALCSQLWSSNWVSMTYNDTPNQINPESIWYQYAGVAYYDLDGITACRGGTPEPSLTFGEGINVYFFRTGFNAPPNTGTATLSFAHVIDDGAVFFLNGVQIGTFAMPANVPTGAGSCSLAASSSTGNAFCRTNAFQVTNLRSGTNILCVQLHQASANETDIAFGTEMDAVFVNSPTLPAPSVPRIFFTRNGNNLTLSWSGNGFRLETKTNIVDIWGAEAQPMSNPYTYTSTDAGPRYFRLQYP
jgi:hypothetical protein